jgi:hypothetical protein
MSAYGNNLADDNRSLDIRLSVSNYAEITPLQKYLECAPGLLVLRVAGRPVLGSQGALDVLTLVASSSSLIAALKIIPEFLRSRRTGLSITTTVKGEKFVLNADNIDIVMPILEKLIDD